MARVHALANEREERAFRILKSCAESNQKCPTNGEFCELLGMDSVGATSGVLSRLEKRGLISIERGQCCRVVTITETGQKTAGTVPTPHWRFNGDRIPGKYLRHSKPAINADPEPEISDLERVDRDPCFLCGTRGDVGCRHRQAA